MKQLIVNIAKFLRLLDQNNELSITNIAVWIVLFKVATTQDVSIVDAGALFVALLNYSGKKTLSFMSEKKKLLIDDEAAELRRIVKENQERVKDLQDKVGAVQAANGMKKIL